MDSIILVRERRSDYGCSKIDNQINNSPSFITTVPPTMVA